MTKISCIIPAFNEAPRIGAVLQAVLDHPMIHEVIVVDDGSSDGTADLADDFATRHDRLRVIRQPQNSGKSRAVASGVEAASGSHILMLDSDLLGLDHEHLAALISPVVQRRAEATISLRRNAPRVWRAIGIDYISGERVMPRALLVERLDELRALPRFGLEVFINELWLDEELRIAIVDWPGVESPFKHTKRGGWLAGIRADISMLGDIFRTVSPAETLRQVFALRARRI